MIGRNAYRCIISSNLINFHRSVPPYKSISTDIFSKNFTKFSLRRCSPSKISSSTIFANSAAFISSSTNSFRDPSTSNDAETLREIFESKIDSPSKSPTIIPEEAKEFVRDNFHELGLGSWWPHGWIQNFLNYMHTTTGLPWWEVIVLATIMIRTCTLPLIVKSQRQSAAMIENQPTLEKLGKRLEEAKKSGDQLQMHVAMMELHEFIREKQMPAMTRAMAPMFANGAIFALYFFALRGMATKSLASMQTEGVLWFTDLTAVDPMLILPTMCALTTFLVMEMGIEFGVGASQMQPEVRWLLRIMPFAIIIFGSKLPAAVLCYWFTSNVISLIVAILFRITAVRQFLKIPPLPPRKKVPLRESWRLPPFVRDYLSGPFLLFKRARASTKTRKDTSVPTSDAKRGAEKNRKSSR